MRALESLYKICDELRDTRSDGWFLMDDVMQVVAIVIVYLLFVGYGPPFMEKRQALGLRWLIVPYNVAMVTVSAYLTYEFFVSAWLSNYSLICQPVDYTNSELSVRMLNATYLFFLTKIIELLDTVFFILRKKNSQVTFLHVYHHSTMPLLMYLGPRFLGGGQGFMLGLVNSFIHTVMYLYYALAAMGPAVQKYLWWKKHLTKLQLVQFVIVITHSVVGLCVSCSYPALWGWAMVTFTFSHVLLFSHFYYTAYIRRLRAQPQPMTALNGHVVRDSQSASTDSSHLQEDVMIRRRLRQEPTN